MEEIARVSSSHEPRLLRFGFYGTLALAAGLVTLTARTPMRLATPSPATPVLLITVDTLRADRLGCYGSGAARTPVMDSLAAQGVRFDDALAQAPITLPSHVVILSGTYPMWNGVRDFTARGLRPDVGLIAEAFERHGYATAAFVSAFVLDSSWGLKRGFETYDDQFDPRQFKTQNPGNIQRRAGETVDHLLAWLRVRKSERPFFIWLHVYDPHSPYDPPEPFRARYAGHLYDGEIAYADSQLGRVFDYLRRAGFDDQTLVVLLSDHGESLGEHGEDEHGFFVYRSTLRVPLIVRLPRNKAAASAPRVVSAPVGTIDVAPTLLDLAGIQDPLSRQFQGRSLAPLMMGPLMMGKTAWADQPVYSETYYPRDSFGWSALRSLSTARHQYIDAPRQELYELAQDPDEKRDVYAERTAEAAALRSQLLDIERRYIDFAAPASTAAPLSPETVEKLKSLGYVGYKAPAADAVPDVQRADPKDKIATLNSILRAADLTRLGKHAEADQVLGRVEQGEPTLYVVPFERGENYLAWGKPEAALGQFKKSLDRNPAFDQAALGLGRAYFLQAQDRQAAGAFEFALRLNPQNSLARLALAKVYWRANLPEKAEPELAQVVKDRPEFAEARADHGIVLAKLGKYGEAATEIRRALESGYRDAIAYNYLGVAHAELGDPAQAVRDYEQAVALNPHYAAAYLNLALQYRKQGDAARAREYYGKVCELSDDLCRQYASQF